MPSIKFDGLASGLDTTSIINALLDVKKRTIVPLQTQVEDRGKTNDSLEEFNTKLLTLQGALQDFRTVSGGGIQKTATVSDGEIIGASASSSALTTTTTISSVSQLAKAATFSFNDRFTATDQPLFAGLSDPVDISLVVGAGDSAETINITVNNQTTLADLTSSINDKAAGKLAASIINTGTTQDPSYALILNGQLTGEAQGAVALNIPQEIQNLGVFQNTTVDQAQDAIFTIAGLGEIRRPTNQISDLLPGLNLTLKAESDAPVTITVSNDATGTSSKIEAIVSALNDLISYSYANSKIQRVEEEGNVTNIFGTLAKSRIDENVIDAIKSAMSSTTVDFESEIKVFSDLGLQLDPLGLAATSDTSDATDEDAKAVAALSYKFDAAKFAEALGKDPVAVQQLMTKLAETVGNTTDGIVAGYTKFQGMIDIEVTSNNDRITSINDKIERINDSLAKQEETLRKVFSSLETKIGKLNAGASAIQTILAAPTPGG